MKNINLGFFAIFNVARHREGIPGKAMSFKDEERLNFRFENNV